MATKVKKEKTHAAHGKSAVRAVATAPVSSAPQSTTQDVPKTPVAVTSSVKATPVAPIQAPTSAPAAKTVKAAPVYKAPEVAAAQSPKAPVKTDVQSSQKVVPNVQATPGTAKQQTVTKIVPVAVQPGQTVRVVRTSTKPLSNNKKLLLAAVPGFFGVMGLSQFYQGKKMKGLAFFVSGIVASFVSSWYIIIQSRLEALTSHSAQLSPYALSFLSSLDMNASLASKLSVDLMGVVAALWGLQLFDAMGPFISRQTVAILTTAVGQKVPVPMPTVRRAISPAPKQPFAESSK